MSSAMVCASVIPRRFRPAMKACLSSRMNLMSCMAYSAARLMARRTRAVKFLCRCRILFRAVAFDQPDEGNGDFVKKHQWDREAHHAEKVGRRENRRNRENADD